MTVDVASLVLAVDSRQVENGDKALDKLAATSSKAEKATDAMTKAYSGYGLAIGAAVTATGYLIKRSIDAADAMNDLHLKTGLAFKDLAAFDQLARQSGTSVEGMAEGFKFLGKYATEYGDKLRSIGVTSKDSATAMGQFADVIASTEDPMLRAALAQEVLGRGGVALLPALVGGSKAFEESRKNTAAYGAALEFAAPRADEFNDMLEAQKTRVTTLGLEIAGGLLPTLNSALSSFEENRDAVLMLGGAYASLKAAAILGPLISATAASAHASLAAAAAARADAMANVERTAVSAKAQQQKLLELQATLATTVAQRAATTSSLAEANATLAAASAVGAYSYAQRLAAGAVAQRSVAVTELAALGRLQVATEAQIAAATTAATVAQVAHTEAATAAAFATRASATASGVAAGALSAMGGPLGALILLIGAGATAWMIFGERGKSAVDDLNAEVEKGIAIADRYKKALKFGSGDEGQLEASLDAVNKKIELLSQSHGPAAAAALAAAHEEAERLQAALYAKPAGASDGGLEERLRKLLAGTKPKKDDANQVLDYVTALQAETEQIGATAIQKKMMDAATVAMTATTDAQRMAVMAAALAWADKTAKTEAETLATEDAKKATDAAKKSQDEWTAGVQRAEQATADHLSSLADRAIAAETELENYGRTRSEIEMTTIARLEEQRAMISGFDSQETVTANLDKEIAARKRAVAAMQGIEERDAMKKASEESAREWAKFADQVEQSLTDALYRSFEAGGNFGETFARNLERTFKAMALKYAIQYVVSYVGGAASQFVSGATGGAVGQAGGMAGQMGSTLVSEGGKWVYNNGGQYVSSLFGGGGAAVGSYAGYGTGIAAGSSSGGLASSVYGSSMANATPAAGSAAAGASGTSWLPIIGWIIAGMTASNELSKQGLGHDGARYDDLNDRTHGLQKFSVGNVLAQAFQGLGFSDRVADILSAAPIDNNMANYLLGGERSVTGSGLQLKVRSNDLNWQSYGYQDWNEEGGAFSDDDTGTSYANLTGDQRGAIQGMLDSVVNGFIKPFNEAFKTDLALNFDFRAGGEGFFKAIEAQLVKGIAESDVGSLFVGITDASGMLAAMQSFANIQTMLQTLNLKTDIKSAGTLAVGVGTDRLQGGMSAYYESFFSDQERATNQASVVNEALTGLLGTSAPKTKEEFRKAVESLDLATESGRGMFASLMDLAPAFSTMIDNLDVAAGGMGRFTDSLIALRESLYTGESSGLSATSRYSTAKGALASATAETMGGAVKEFLDASRGVARTSLDYARDRAMADAAITGAIGVPQFAAGGYHSGGARIVGENGPEIEFTGPSRIASHSQSKALLDNSEVVAELRAVRAELASLRAAAQSTATNTQRTEQTLRNVTNGGNTLRTELA